MTVSIIIPCFNVESFIEECIDSVLNQNYEKLEVIAVDNNSTDSTLEKLYELKLNKIPGLVIVQELKKGACAARNKGLSVAKGEWVQFLDADDLILSKKISRQIDIIQDNLNCSIVVGSSEYLKLNGDTSISKPIRGNAFVSIFIRGFGNTCSNLWNKSILNEVGNWNESLSSSQESDLMFRIIELNNNVEYDETSQTQIRERESGQISQSNPISRWENIISVRMKALELKRFVELKKEDKADLFSFLIAAILFLSKYDFKKSYLYAKDLLRFDITNLKPKYGLTKKHIILIKTIGILTTIKMNSIFTKKD